MMFFERKIWCGRRSLAWREGWDLGRFGKGLCVLQWGVASLEGSGDRCCLPVYLSTWLAFL